MSSQNIESLSSVEKLVEELASLLLRYSYVMTTAESCTGGLIAAALTSAAGSSAYFNTGIVSYSNDTKRHLLGVPARALADHGAVSKPVVLAMADGARRRDGANVAVSVSGIAGPGGGSSDKPVGTVWIGWSIPVQNTVQTDAELFVFEGDRAAIREAAVVAALRGTIARLTANNNSDN